MIRKLIHKWKMFRNPPKRGDVFRGDSFDFVIGSAIEAVLHGLRSKEGSAVWTPVPSEDAYRLTIDSDQMFYYVCTAEVLAASFPDMSTKKWMKRCQPRRIRKEVFHEMIFNKRLEKV